MSVLSENQKTRSALLSCELFDKATIIAAGGADPGFPVENLQDQQPKVKWKHSEGPPVATHFIADLGPDAGGRVYNAFAALFHNSKSDPAANRWRIQTGDGSAGTGVYDSGFIPLWDFATAPAERSFRSAEFYQDSGPGSHSYHILSPAQVIEEFSNYITIQGGSVDFGNVLDIGGGDYTVQVRVRRRAPLLVGAMTVIQAGIVDVTNGNGVGFSVALAVGGAVVATLNDGISPPVVVSGGSVQAGEWVTIGFRFSRVTNQLRLEVDGLTVDDEAASLGAISSASALTLGQNAGGSQAAQGLDIERVVITNQAPTAQHQEAEWNGLYDVNLRSTVLPSYVTGAWPIDTGFGNVIFDVGPSGFDGTLIDAVTWSGGPGILAQRYVRVDFEIDRNTLSMARFVIARALEPIVPYPAPLPSPQGSPPKPVVTWPARFTQEQFEEIAYALAFNRGNAPRFIDSWGHDRHLLDGGKTLVAVNNIAAAQPWQRQQQTVYGYIEQLDETRRTRSQLVDASLTIRGL